jgi:hypothetical protein
MPALQSERTSTADQTMRRWSRSFRDAAQSPWDSFTTEFPKANFPGSPLVQTGVAALPDPWTLSTTDQLDSFMERLTKVLEEAVRVVGRPDALLRRRLLQRIPKQGWLLTLIRLSPASVLQVGNGRGRLAIRHAFYLKCRLG